MGRQDKRRRGLTAVILAAGKGTRMRSELAKVLHPLCGLPLGAWPIEAARRAGAGPIVVVVGHQEAAVREALTLAAPKAELRFAVQAEQRGTGHAVMCAVPKLASGDEGRVLILCGDVPSLAPATLERLARAGEKAEVALLTFEAKEPGSYGRIVRDEAGRVTEIVEAKDASRAVKAIREVNAGIYCVKKSLLLQALDSLRTDNSQGELYLTDMVSFAVRAGAKVSAILVDEAEVEGVNDRADLARAAGRLRASINDSLMRSGVTLEDPGSTYVDAGVVVGKDSVLFAGVHLLGETRIGRGVFVGPYSVLHHAKVDSGARIKAHCVIESAVIGPKAQVGPFARLRPGTVLERGAAVGNFVETKKAHLHEGVKAGHLSYLGDAEIGAGTNIGAGTITCNYDGKSKYRTVIGANAFIGSNTALVAPVEVGNGAYVGAGSTLTQDVPEGALGVARGKQRNLEGWAKRKEAGRSGAAAKRAGSRGTEAARRRKK